MKDFINVLLILLLAACAVGIAYLTRTCTAEKNLWPILYFPLFIVVMFFGAKINNDYMD